MINDRADEVIEKNFQSFFSRCWTGLDTLMRGSDFIFDCVHSLYYKFHQISFKRVGSYIDSPDWIKNKKGIKNSINEKDNECFQYTITVK